jgi:methylmalonyl-CoA/ethylmalonyl-CoA epimerase
MIGRLSHIGIIVDDLDQALITFEKLFGLQAEESKNNENIRAAFIPVGEGEIELLEPRGDSRLFNEKREKWTIHHLAFETDDIEEEIGKIKAKRARMVHDEPVMGLHGVKIAFITSETLNGLNVELIETRK